MILAFIFIRQSLHDHANATKSPCSLHAKMIVRDVEPTLGMTQHEIVGNGPVGPLPTEHHVEVIEKFGIDHVHHFAAIDLFGNGVSST